jgi:hypothetical protein
VHARLGRDVLHGDLQQQRGNHKWGQNGKDNFWADAYIGII